VSQPGLLVLSPQGRVLAPGGTTSVSISLVDSTGTPLPARTNVTWDTSDSYVATVDANGTVTAVNLGQALIIGTDGVHGLQYLPISVADAAHTATGVSGVEFTPALVQVAAGATQHVTVTARGPSGQAIDASTVTFAVRDPSVASVTPSGDGFDIVGLAHGLSDVLSTNADPTLTVAGGLTVIVRGPSSASGDGGGGGGGDAGDGGSGGGGGGDGGSGGGGGGGGDGGSGGGGGRVMPCNTSPSAYTVTGCAFTNGGTVGVLTQPGLTRDIRVFAVSEPPSVCPPETPYLYYQGPPDSLTFMTGGVVSYANGQMTSLSPGASTYYAKVGPAQCQIDAYPPVRVGVNNGGTWGIVGANMDTGTFSTGTVRGIILGAAGWGGTTGTISNSYPATSCISNTADMYMCSGAGTTSTLGIVNTESDHLCSDANPCAAGESSVDATPTLGFTACAPVSRHENNGVMVYSNDHVKIGTYDFTRGGSGSCGAPTMTSGSCDGTFTLTIANIQCGTDSIPGTTETITVKNGVATGTGADGTPFSEAVGSDCSVTNPATAGNACGPQPATTIQLKTGGTCQSYFALETNGTCYCDPGIANCSVTKN
jgi:hypothetical protein